MGIADGFQGRSKNPRLTFHTLHPEFHASEHFSFLRNGSKQNSESFLFRGTAGITP